jgi:hypothetical protein
MQDLDSAVGRLDNILMTVYIFIVVLIFAAALVRRMAFLCRLFRNEWVV